MLEDFKFSEANLLFGIPGVGTFQCLRFGGLGYSFLIPFT